MICLSTRWFDFYDQQICDKGYASFDYQMTEYRRDNLVKMSILVNDEPDALSARCIGIVQKRGDGRGEKLKDLIPRHMFKIPIQAATGGKVLHAKPCRSAQRCDGEMLRWGCDANCKLLTNKRRQKKDAPIRQIDIPQEAFISALKMDKSLVVFRSD